jgi:hypothetical protein
MRPWAHPVWLAVLLSLIVPVKRDSCAGIWGRVHRSAAHLFPAALLMQIGLLVS